MTFDRLHSFRELFPHVATGRNYLNHASTAPYATPVLQRIDAQLRFRSLGGIDNYREDVEFRRVTKAMLGELLHCAPDRLAFVQNTSDGLNILANGLQWKRGDRILLNDIEFPCNVYPFLNQQRHGVEIDYVRSVNGRIELADFERAITPRTRLLSVSWVQFLSGFRCDLAALASLCKARGVILCVDAIQGLGALQLDVVATGIDFLSCGAQKWMLSPQGIAFIYLTEEMQRRIVQQNVGWLGVKNSWDFFDYDLDLLDTAQRYEGATYNPLGIAGLNGALTLFLDAGMENVERSVTTLASHAHRRLREANLDVLTPDAANERAGIVTFRHQRSDEIFLALQSMKIDVAARVGCIRVAPHFYNTVDEVDAAVDAIVEFAAP